MKGYIYCIENLLNNKQYIGKTYSTIDERWKQHLSDSKADRNKERPIYRAINKYGSENFIIYSIDQYEEGILEEEEINFIKKYNTYVNNGKGYNATYGGKGKKYLNLNIDKVLNDYNKFKNMKKVARINNCSYESIRNVLVDNNINIIKNPAKKMVKIDTLNLTFNSVTETAMFLVENNYTTCSIEATKKHISRYLNGHRKSFMKMNFSFSN